MTKIATFILNGGYENLYKLEDGRVQPDFIDWEGHFRGMGCCYHSLEEYLEMLKSPSLYRGYAFGEWCTNC